MWHARGGSAAQERTVCGCCGRELPRSSVHELGGTPGVFICRRCAAWTLFRRDRRT